MNERIVDDEITLIPYYPAYEETFEWYQDPVLCKQVDNIDHTYSMEELQSMYTFLDANGDCFYIRYRGELAGDVTLRDNKEICIVVKPGCQNLHIGRRCVAEMLKLAKEKQFDIVRANIYAFNHQSQRMFLSAGFRQVDEEWFEYTIS